MAIAAAFWILTAPAGCCAAACSTIREKRKAVSGRVRITALLSLTLFAVSLAHHCIFTESRRNHTLRGKWMTLIWWAVSEGSTDSSTDKNIRMIFFIYFFFHIARSLLIILSSSPAPHCLTDTFKRTAQRQTSFPVSCILLSSLFSSSSSSSSLSLQARPLARSGRVPIPILESFAPWIYTLCSIDNRPSLNLLHLAHQLLSCVD